MKLLKTLSFGTIAALLIALAAGTVVEKLRGNAYAAQTVYHAPWFIAAWLVAAICAIAYMLRRKLHKRRATFLLHASFAVILAGAMTSWIWGKEGRLELREGETADKMQLDGGATESLPFSLTLDSFEVIYYEGTRAPMDFVSRVTAHSGDGATIKGDVSMNNVFSVQGYRFYQAGYDSDEGGSVFKVARDPAGIAVTYTGYAMLLLSIIAFFFERDNGFRRLWRKIKADGKPAAAVILAMLCMGAAESRAETSELPPTIPANVAEKFGDLYVLYNDRVCPLQTMAREFTAKLCGATSYRGLSAEQVTAGWLFRPTEWSAEPMIAIKSAEVRKLLGIEGKYASMRNFFSTINQYKLEEPLNHIEAFPDPRGLREAAEKFELVSNLTSGRVLKIFPYKADGGQMDWYAQTDNLPPDMPSDQWTFVKMSMSYANEMSLKRQWTDLEAFFTKVKAFQEKSGGASLPSPVKFKAEKSYNASISAVRPAAMAATAIGLVAFFAFSLLMAKRRRPARWLMAALLAVIVLLAAYLTALIALLWIVGGHVPMSNGFETMLFLAWCACPLTLIARKRMPLALPMGLLLCGMAMMVAMMGISNPRITQLMPVLQSPLLSAHVAVIMVAYALLAFTMLNGVAAVVIRLSKGSDTASIDRLKDQSRLLLYPAVFLLAIGIFIGAVWANMSWGRYWGWDPKEVWALITLLVYAFAFHGDSLSPLRRRMAFHVFMIAAFLSVLFTYFGVNFLLTGMHSYA